MTNTPVREDDSTLVRVLEAHVETLKAENEILRRRLAAAEARTAQETAKAERRQRCARYPRRAHARLPAFRNCVSARRPFDTPRPCGRPRRRAR